MLSVVIEAPTSYGVTTSECEALGDLKTDLLVKYETAQDANQHKLAMFETRNVTWEEVLNLTAEFTKRIYAKQTVTNAMLKAAGLSERNPPVKRSATTPTDLVATPFANGDVELKWKRNGNPPNAVFTVEVRGSTGGWTALGNFTTTRIKLNGFAPGQEKFFRVTSTRNEQVSGPSNEALIYPSGGEFFLQQAA